MQFIRNLRFKIQAVLQFFVLIIVIVSICITPAFAYSTFGYKLIGGVSGRYYYYSTSSYTYNGSSVDYGTAIISSMAKWNYAVDATSSSSVDVSFSRTTTSSEAAIVFSVLNRGATGVAGVTTFYNSAGNLMCDEGSAPSANYYHVRIILNVYYLHSNQYIRYNVTAHEIGHALGLLHSSSALMRYDIVNVTTSYCSPSSDDVAGVRAANK